MTIYVLIVGVRELNFKKDFLRGRKLRASGIVTGPFDSKYNSVASTALSRDVLGDEIPVYLVNLSRWSILSN